MINNKYDGSGQRLLQIRKSLKMTQVEFAKLFNSSNGHVSDMEKDRKNITDTTIELLKLKCNINEEWLRDGIGEMFEPRTRRQKIADFSADLLKEEEESFKTRLIEVLADLNECEWEVLEKIAKRAIKKD